MGLVLDARTGRVYSRPMHNTTAVYVPGSMAQVRRVPGVGYQIMTFGGWVTCPAKGSRFLRRHLTDALRFRYGLPV